MKKIPYGKQHIDKKDIDYVSAVLKKDKITSGEEVEKFEKKINNYLKCSYSTTCNSGTSAIFLAMQAIELKKNDIIIMPSVNFTASYNVAKMLGAKVYLADIDKITGQMSPKNVEDCCKKFNLKSIKAILIMYNGGYPENAENFVKLKYKFKSFLIEDACHALGAEYNLKNKRYKVGCCKHSDISTFSLHPLKTITTGEGGIVTTNLKHLDEKIKKLRSLGIKKNIDKHWSYDVLYNGLNFRLNDFQCALGISQLNKISSFIKLRTKISKKYDKELKNIDQISILNHSDKYKSSHHLYLIHLKEKNFKLKEKLIRYMLTNNIILQYHYIPIYKFKNFKGKYINKNAEIYYKTCLSLPIYPHLSIKDHAYIVKKLKKFFNINE
jgi:dTDP-4-amino-4,6-dideoxygalactose transaminase